MNTERTTAFSDSREGSSSPTASTSPGPSPGGGWRLRLAQLTCWYLALLVPTIAFKGIYIRGIGQAARGHASWFLTALGTGGPLRRGVRLFLVFRPDLIEVALIVAVLYVVGALFFRIRVRYLVAASLAVSFLLGIANCLSEWEVGTLLTHNLLSISWDWVRQHPEVVTGVMTPPRMALLLVSLLLTALLSYGATLFAAPAAAGARPPRSRRIAAVVTLPLFAGALLTPGPILPRLRRAANDPAGVSRFSGYWSSTAVSLFGREPYDPRQITPASPERLTEDYWAMVYPGGRPHEPDLLVRIPPERVRPRHIVLVALETAPAKYYPLAELPVFKALAERSIVGTAHHSNSPATDPAIYTIVSGTYARPGEQLGAYGPFATDSLPAVLRRHGYETVYIDGSRIDWHRRRDVEGSAVGQRLSTNERTLLSLGFARLKGTRNPGKTFDDQLAIERGVLDTARQAIFDADRHGTKAFVFVMMTIGHFPWKAKPEDAGRPAAEKLLRHARFYDELIGSFLASLEAKGLRDEVVLAVTGDHGLRHGAEYQSLDEPMMVGDAAFHVPLIIHAPGLLDAQVPVPYATSHVDLAPTLLGLVGISTHGLMLHGENILDRRMEHRVSFFLNRGLTPVDGFHWEGRYFTVDNLSGETSSRPAVIAPANWPLRRADGRPWAPEDTRNLLEHGYEIINSTASYFLRRIQHVASLPGHQ